jgi:hypothetical protein
LPRPQLRFRNEHRRDEAFESPAWHAEELRKTAADFAAGKVEVLDWEDAKKELRRRFE